MSPSYGPAQIATPGYPVDDAIGRVLIRSGKKITGQTPTSVYILVSGNLPEFTAFNGSSTIQPPLKKEPTQRRMDSVADHKTPVLMTLVFFERKLLMTGVSGTWAIHSVQVDAEPVLNDEGFEQLLVTPSQIVIEPAGIEFSVSQATSRSAILESRSQVYFAEYFKTSDGQLTLELSRPAFNEKVRLNASMN